MANNQQMVPITEALKALGIAIPNTSRSSFEIPCPCCDKGLVGKKSIFRLNVNLAKNAFRCAKCGESGGPAGLYGYVRYGYRKIDMTPQLKLEMIQEILGVKKGERINTNNYTFETYDVKRVDLDPAPLEVRNKTYEAFFNRLTLSDEHYNNLIKRGLREEDIIRNGYKSTPRIGVNKIPADLRRVDACTLAGVPGFYKNDSQWALCKVNRGFFIPVRDIPSQFGNLGMINGLQIRFDVVDDDMPRYKWLSSRDMESGCPAETWSHFVGFPEKEIILTEGPLKGDIINRFLDKPVLCIPGVHALEHLERLLKILYSYGVRHVQTAFDMDYMLNAHVQDAYVNLVNMLYNNGFTFERLMWDENYKGLDDYLLHRFLESGGKLDPLK